LLPHLKGLRLEALTVADDGITIVAATTRRRARCPVSMIVGNAQVVDRVCSTG